MFLSLALLERHSHELFQLKSNMSLEALRVNGLDRKDWFKLIEARIELNNLVPNLSQPSKPKGIQTAMHVFVRVLCGRTIPIGIEGSDTVDLLQRKILDLEGIPARSPATGLFWQDAQQKTYSQSLQRH
ncbi:hypothetical protein MVEG_07260 [Podila verticillata NRRL 6337]|nr:hypothetical protein MVEG_07260 [Podila verticillata NRRL 6337]